MKSICATTCLFTFVFTLPTTAVGSGSCPVPTRFISTPLRTAISGKYQVTYRDKHQSEIDAYPVTDIHFEYKPDWGFAYSLITMTPLNTVCASRFEVMYNFFLDPQPSYINECHVHRKYPVFNMLRFSEDGDVAVLIACTGDLQYQVFILLYFQTKKYMNASSLEDALRKGRQLLAEENVPQQLELVRVDRKNSIETIIITQECQQNCSLLFSGQGQLFGMKMRHGNQNRHLEATKEKDHLWKIWVVFILIIVVVSTYLLKRVTRWNRVGMTGDLVT